MRVTIDEKRFGHEGPLVIDRLDFSVTPGEMLVLFGPSGCGKTTLLNLMAGLDADYSGSIQWGEVAPPIGYVFQEPRLLPWLTVADNIRLVLENGVTDDPRVARLLDEMDLAAVGDRHASRLSLGMARRVSIARALAVDPGLLLQDEPFVSLDGPTAQRLRDLVLGLRDHHDLTVIHVTHDIREAVYLADRILFLSAGPARLLAELPVALDRAARDPAAIERFIAERVAGDPGLAPLLVQKADD